MTDPSAAAPPQKRGRGRPKADKAVTTPLHIFRGSKRDRLQELYNSWANCKRCFLGEHRELSNGPDYIVFGEGNPDAHVLIVGEAPGIEEERSGVPFLGNSGQLLNQLLAMTSGNPEIRELCTWYDRAPRNPINNKRFHDEVTKWRHEEFFITNVVGCRPPENRTPTNDEVKVCWERLWNIIYIVDPILILAVGRIALGALMRKKQTEVLRYRGDIRDTTYEGRFGTLTYPIMPIVHPSYLLRIADWRQKGGDYEKTVDDIRRAMKMVDFVRNQQFGTPIPVRDWSK